ncbi:MAG: hypothetical protein ACI85N_001355 [Gammaproteobacteria bacterium]|jgi:hypothetical protein
MIKVIAERLEPKKSIEIILSSLYCCLKYLFNNNYKSTRLHYNYLGLLNQPCLQKPINRD